MIGRDLSPEQFHRLLNIIKEIVAVMRWPSLLRHLRVEIRTSLHEIPIKSEGVFFGITKSQFLTPLFISSASLYIGSEQSGNRPAVVLQNDVGNFYSPTLIVATLTSKAAKKVYPADPLTHPPHRRQGFADPPARCTRA